MHYVYMYFIYFSPSGALPSTGLRLPLFLGRSMGREGGVERGKCVYIHVYKGMGGRVRGVWGARTHDARLTHLLLVVYFFVVVIVSASAMGCLRVPAPERWQKAKARTVAPSVSPYIFLYRCIRVFASRNKIHEFPLLCMFLIVYLGGYIKKYIYKW